MCCTGGNPAYFRLYGYAPEAVLGKSFSVIFREEQRPSVKAQYTDMFRGEVPPPMFQSVVKRQDGTERVAESRTARLAGLADELVELAALPEGRSQPLRLAMVDLVALARETVDRHQRLTDDHQIILDATVASLQGLWDGPRLVGVLDNLLANAISYCPSGGRITVRLAVADALRTGPGALASIQDEGIGITASDVPHAFNRFHRGVNIPDTVPGAGIGLTSIQQIVEQHGGTIQVASQIGVRTTVTLCVPIRPTDNSVVAGT
jgi:signal transduction histidine kinase